MAEAPGKDTPQPDSKVVGKTGPVKPPVLEGTARPAGMGEEKPASRASDKPASQAAKTEPPKPSSPAAPKPSAQPRKADEDTGGAPWLAGIIGGVVGLAAAYGVAYLGLWPSPTPAPVQADPRIAQFASAIPELQTVTGTVQDELSTLNGRVSELESAPASAPSPNQDVAEDLSALSARLDELAAAPAPEPDTAALDALRSQVDALRQELDASKAEIAALSKTAESAAATDTARLPLVFSALESAFASGRPFEAELSALQDAQPEAQLPSTVSARAATGLPRPDEVARRLEAVLPDMLAGRPVAADASWQDATADWFRGVVAMRPAGDVEGDSPDAIVSRLEAAVARRDFSAAQTEFDALPETMRNAAGTLGDDIAALAAASATLTDLRQSALSAEANS